MLTGRNHHSNAMSCITEGATGYPGGNGLIPFENGFLSEILLGNGYNTFAVGKWHLTPTEQASAAGPYDRWPLGRGFERFYGFMGGDTHQYYPDLVYDNHQVPAAEDARGGLPPDRGSRRPRDRVHRRQPSRSRPTSRSSSTSARGRCTRRTTCRAHGPTSTRAVRRRLGRLPREGVQRGSSSSAWCRPGPSSPRAIPTSLEWKGLPRRREAALRADDGGVRRIPRAHRSPHRTAARLPRQDRTARRHARHAGERQRRQRRRAGRTARSTRTSSSTTSPRPPPTASRRSTISADRSASTIIRGAGPGRATPPSGAGSARPTAAAPAIRSSSTGRSGIKAKGEIRTQYAHIIDMLPTVLEALGLEAPRRSAA